MQPSLRQRIRPIGINCTPWRIWKGEIELLPISAQTLFKKTGLPIDILEMELKSDGWLFENEILLEVLKIESNLKRTHFSIDEPEDDEPFDDSWTDKDYEEFYNNLGK